MQGVDTPRIKLDDSLWRVQCAECGSWFEAKRSDASFCKPAHRKLWHQRPARKQAALADLAYMATRIRTYANEYSRSQDMLDALGALEVLIRKQRLQMDVVWKPQELPTAIDS